MTLTVSTTTTALPIRSFAVLLLMGAEMSISHAMPFCRGGDAKMPQMWPTGRQK